MQRSILRSGLARVWLGQCKIAQEPNRKAHQFGLRLRPGARQRRAQMKPRSVNGDPFTLGKALQVVVGGKRRNAFGDTTPATHLGFASGGTPFEVAGVPIAHNAAAVELGSAGKSRTTRRSAWP